MNEPDPKWQKLVAAARHVATDPTPDDPPPPGFTARVLGLRESIIALARVLFWRRWSLWIALLSVAAFIAILTAFRCTAPRAPLINTPEPPSTQPMIR